MPDVSPSNPQYKHVCRTIPLAAPNQGEPRVEVDQVVSYVTTDGEVWNLQSIADISPPRPIKK
jgi:hypothetical protein